MSPGSPEFPARVRRMRSLALVTVGVVGLAHGLRVDAEPARPTTTQGIVRDIHTRGRYPDDLEVVVPGEGGTVGTRRTRPIFGGRRAPRLQDAPNAAPEGCDDSMHDWTPPAWLEALLELLGASAKLVMVVVVALVAGGLLWLLVRFRLRPAVGHEAAPARRTRPNRAPARTPDALLEVPLEGHAAYAARGLYREAIHALFVETLVESGFSGSGRQRGTTAREVVAALAARDTGGALAGLLSITERVWFGGRAADVSTYEEALAIRAAVATRQVAP